MALYLGSSKKLRLASQQSTGAELAPYDIYVINNEAINPSSNLTNTGLCMIIHGKQNILIDLGYDVNCTNLINKCKELNISFFDYAFITHYHSDHVTSNIESALNNLVANDINIKHFILPHKTIAWEKCSSVSWYSEIKNHEQKCINYLTNNNIPYVQPEEKEIIGINSHLQSQCFNVSNFSNNYYNTSTIEYNNFSAIYKFLINGYTFVISGDATPLVQECMAQQIGKCDILQVEHHGINRKGCKAWCDTLKPSISIASRYDSKYYDLYLAASPNVIEYMKTSVFYTNINKEIVIEIGNGLNCSGMPVPGVKSDSESLVNISTYARNSVEKGVSFESDENGIIYADGTASDGNANFYAVQRLTVDEPTEVIFGGCPPNGSDSTYLVTIGAHTETSWNSVAHEYGTGATTTLQPGTEYLLACRVKNGTSVNKIEFKPFICHLNAQASGYIRSLEYKIAQLDQRISNLES